MNMNEYIFFLANKNRHSITTVNSKYLCKHPKYLGC